jgi:hypothetical protein
LKGSSALARTENPFDGLTDRQRFIGVLLNRLQSQRSQNSLVGDALLLRIWDWEPVLEDIPDYAIEHCFKQAVKLHSSEFPVQANEISIIWLEMSESTKEELYKATGVKALPAARNCEWCNGTGRMRVKVIGVGKEKSYTPVKWASNEETNTMAQCYCNKVA